MVEEDLVDVVAGGVEGELLVYERPLRNDLDRCHDLNVRDLALWRGSELLTLLGG